MGMIKPGHTSLNMDDISEDLQVVHRHITKVAPTTTDSSGREVNMREGGSLDNPVLPAYRNKIIKADDVDLVAGVKADMTATAISSSNRTTIDNSLHLNGKTDTDFASSSLVSGIQNQATNTSKLYGDELTEIRDELYFLKHELEKQGLIRNTNQSFGYNDIFRNGYKPYEYQPLGKPIEDCPDNVTIRMPESGTTDLDAGDFIAIYYEAERKVDVRQVKSVAADGETVTLDNGLSPAYAHTARNMTVYKSYGVSRDGNFYFARDAEVKIGDSSFWTGLDDDTTPKMRRPVGKSDSSYGYSFRIPEEKRGYLTKFSIQAVANGMPTLTCYIIDEEDIGNFHNPQQAKKLYESGDTNADGEKKMKFFAESNPLQLDKGMVQTMYSFDFYNVEKGGYPLLTRKDTPVHRVRYVAIIVGTYVDANNFADIYFLQDSSAVAKGNPLADLETNNTVYYYTEQPEKSSTSALSTDDKLNNSDLYYEVTIKEPIQNDLEALPQGIYSARMHTTYPKGISRARLTMRISREGGIWNTKMDNPQIIGTTVNPGVTVECTPPESIRNVAPMGLHEDIRKPMELRKSPTDITMYPDIIIGPNITSGNGNDLVVTSNKPVYVQPNDMVYRNAFVVSVKGKRWAYNARTMRYDLQESKKIYLDPICVVPDGIKYKNDTYSDRIVFEGDFRNADGSPAFFNDLELQIYWERANLSESEDMKKKQMGIIHDLVFSTDIIAK